MSIFHTRIHPDYQEDTVTTTPELHSETTHASAKFIIRETFDLPEGEYIGASHDSGRPDLSIINVTVVLVAIGADAGWSPWNTSAAIRGRRILKSGQLGVQDKDVNTYPMYRHGEKVDDPRVTTALELRERCIKLALAKHGTPAQAFERMEAE